MNTIATKPRVADMKNLERIAGERAVPVVVAGRKRTFLSHLGIALVCLRTLHTYMD